MKSEILLFIENNFYEMQELINKQKFTVGDAERIIQQKYLNIIRKFEQLVISRDSWKKKYEELKSSHKTGCANSEGKK